MAYIGKQPTPVPLTSSDVADGIISNAKLAQDIISADTALGVAPADTDELLISDAGVLKRIDYSLLKSTPAHTLLQTITISSGTASADFTSNIDSTYKLYVFDIINLHPATDAQTVRVRFSQSSSFVTSSIYDHTFVRMDSNTGGHSDVRAENNDHFDIANNLDNASDASVSGRVFIYDPASTTFEKGAHWQTVYTNDGGPLGHTTGSGRLDSTTAVDGVQFYMGSGNIDSAVIKMYGVT